VGTLRERKKLLVRQAILDSAERLFEERGFDAVTVAEIADAANVSVKTLFVYFRSKEDLAFADTGLIDALVAALRGRPPGMSAAEAVGAALRELAGADDGLEGYHRLVGDSPALRSRLLRLWAEYEDTLVAVLTERGGPPSPRTRLQAAQLIAVVRSLTSPEVRAAVARGTDGADRRRILSAWLDEAVHQVSSCAGRP
jgi:AcrR family transcriptional regulator